MDIDKKDNVTEVDQDSMDERQDTPEPLEDETASELDDEGPPAPAHKEGGRAEINRKTTPAASSANTTWNTRASVKPEVAEPPPPRELPFGKKNVASKPVVETNVDGETDSEDDEL